MPALLVIAAVAGVVTYASGHADYSTGPPAGRTGATIAPAEGTCSTTGCHFDGTPNLNQPGGSVQILDLPDWYSPGTTYRLRVRLSSTATAADPSRRWGFELTAVQAGNGQGVGAFTVRGNQIGGQGGDTLQIKNGTGSNATRRYVQHLYEGTRQGTASPSEWSFNWTAPASGVGTVYFFAAGNAANGSEDPTGDWIYTTADSMRDTTTAVVARSWGAVKQRWR